MRRTRVREALRRESGLSVRAPQKEPIGLWTFALREKGDTMLQVKEP